MLQHEGLDSCQLCSQPILQIGDFCQPDCELPGPITIKFGQQATPDESVSNIKFDRIINTAVEGEHGIFPKPQQIANQWSCTTNRDRDRDWNLSEWILRWRLTLAHRPSPSA